MKVKIKSLKVDLSKIEFQDPDKVNDGVNGKLLESAMIEQGFKISQHDTTDLPGIEIKSRGARTNAKHTIGTMTYDDILKTPYDQTTFKQKLQVQYRVTIKASDSASGHVVDFSDEEIQRYFREAYESCRSQLAAQGKIIEGQTIKGGQYGSLEHKPSKTGNSTSYAFRVPNSGMKKQLQTENLLSKGFEFV